MPEWIWHWSGYAVALLAFVGVAWALFWDRSRGRKRCRRCWYDMAGVPTEPGDLPAACPECGRGHAKPRHLTRTRRRWGRVVVLGLVMVVGGYGLWVVPRVQDEGVTGVVPTTVLFAGAPWFQVAIEPGRFGAPDSDDYLETFELVFDQETAMLDRLDRGKPEGLGEVALLRCWTVPRMQQNPTWFVERALDWWRLNGLLAVDEWSHSETEPVMYRLHRAHLVWGIPSDAYSQSLVWHQFLDAASSRDIDRGLKISEDYRDLESWRFFVPRRTPRIPHPARLEAVWSVDRAGPPFASASAFWDEEPFPPFPRDGEMTRYLQLRDSEDQILRMARVRYRVEGVDTILEALEAGESGDFRLRAFPIEVQELELP
ncbi:MAG: hypothetical protein AAFZ67_01115 [Planctomycetota bacterium]